jgi:4-hydroxy-tetrahydrodipicolinate reductase
VSEPKGIAILGVTGRMGRALLVALPGFADLRLVGATASATSEWLGKDVRALGSNATLTVDADVPAALRQAQVAVDFALPEATPFHVRCAANAGVPIVIGTTGHTAEQRTAIMEASGHLPIVLAPNMSLGINVLLKLAELAASALNSDYDVEIFEAHHRNKKDAPSGTALRIGEVVAQVRGTTLDADGVFAREGETGARPRGAIGFSVFRGGDVVGDHTLTFAGPGERIELTHRAHDRSGFARGALTAACWAIGKPPGLYSMQDVLGLGVVTSSLRSD